MSSAFKPWDGQRGESPLAVLIRHEKDVAREAARRETPMGLLERATPEQIKAASRGCMGIGTTRADIAAAWDRLRTMVNA
jgi:hypothetical protein